MLANLKLHVSFTDDADPIESVAPTPGVLIAAERKYKKSAATLFADPSIELMAWLAWETIRRSGTTVETFDRWIDRIADLEVENESAPLDGTAPSGS